MTEIPEHLLARSRARRAEAGLATPGEAATAAPAAGGEVEPAPSATPATGAARAPAVAPGPAAPPPPRPDPPHVAAYKERQRIPWWALSALAALPIWALVYVYTLEPPSQETAGVLAEGEQVYNTCAACHGASGGGGVGPALGGGAVVQTFPNYQDHILWVTLGSAEWPADTYGAQNESPGGTGVMPAFGNELSPAEIIAVVRYEREVLGGAPPEPGLVELSEQAEAGEDVTTLLATEPSADPTQPAPAPAGETAAAEG